MPADLKGLLEEAAHNNRRSMNSEIVTRLQQTFDQFSVLVQMQPEFQEKLAAAARASGRTVSEEIVARIAQSFGEPLQADISDSKRHLELMSRMAVMEHMLRVLSDRESADHAPPRKKA